MNDWQWVSLTAHFRAVEERSARPAFTRSCPSPNDIYLGGSYRSRGQGERTAHQNDPGMLNALPCQAASPACFRRS